MTDDELSVAGMGDDCYSVCMKTCPKCRSEQAEDSRFCNRCGLELSGGRRGRAIWLPIVSAAVMIAVAGVSITALWVARHRIAPYAENGPVDSKHGHSATTTPSAELPSGSGPAGTRDIDAEARYRSTFAGGREEKWRQTLALDSRDGLARLDALLEAYRYPRKLSDNQLPLNLDPGRMGGLLNIMVEDLAAAGHGPEVIERFDRRTLLEIGDPDLVIRVADLTAAAYGPESALGVIESVKAYLELSPIEATRLDQAHRDMYARLLDELIARRDWVFAAQTLAVAQREFSADPQLHMFEVRLALADGDWRKAERLLAERTIPVDLSDQAMSLQSEIDRLKGVDGTIVIRFDPGSRHIGVTAELNGEASQAFLIDTGASMVTIPLATARRLGIVIDGNVPVRTVYTAGGPVRAPEVTLEEIALGGRGVRQVDALVLDIPGQSDLGLLGLNFLQRFDMDLQTDRGILTLTPK